MNPPPIDPFAHDPRRWVGRQVAFDKPGTEHPVKSERLTGTVISHTWAGLTARGQIPDYALLIEGRSGRRLTVSMVEAHASFPA